MVAGDGKRPLYGANRSRKGAAQLKQLALAALRAGIPANRSRKGAAQLKHRLRRYPGWDKHH